MKDELMWLNHKDFNGEVVSNSEYGNKCKVEVISRSDLLRARGYKGVDMSDIIIEQKI